MNFAYGIHNEKHCLQLYFFQENQYWWTLSCLRRQSAGPSLLTATPGTFSLLESRCISTPWTLWLWFVVAKLMFSPFIKFFFFWLKQTFLYMLHSYVNFMWFALLSQQKFNQPVSGTVILNSLKTKIFEGLK